MMPRIKWDNIYFEKSKLYSWIFINGISYAVNEFEYYKMIKQNYINKKNFYNGTKIRKEKGNKNEDN